MIRFYFYSCLFLTSIIWSIAYAEGYAPSSIAGYTITYTGNGETETATFSADGNVSDGNDWTYYIYEKISENVGEVTYTFANETNPAPEVETLNFTSASSGTYDWKEYADSSKNSVIDQGSGEFTLIQVSGETDIGSDTVISDPDGRPVVVQEGEEYSWSSTLDGVILWGVWEDSEDGWVGATIKYENGMQKGSIGLTDQLGPNLEVNHPYTIDENGMIKVTEDTAFQYYQVSAVENGVIITKDGSTFPLSDTSKFFTSLAAAQEYYNSKLIPRGWLWFDHYPWVYSFEENGWLYIQAYEDKFLYWSAKKQIWAEFGE